MSTRKTAKIFGQRNWIGMAVVLALLGIGGGILLSGGSDSSGGRINLAGRARLISVEPLPDPAFEMDGVMCEWVPASASGSLFASLQQATPDEREAEREAIRQRKPLRIIKDRYASFSAVAVDPVRDEVVMADESLFQLLSYDRLTNTPPTASMSEPKRMIGGLDTKIDYICGLYIDPGSGDIYAINNDTVDTMVIFDRDAKGNLPPTRELYTPHGTYGIAVNEADQEIFLTVQHDSAVVVFAKSAEKDEPPLRYLQGENTGLADPHGIALNPERGLMYVANFGSVHYHDANLDNPSRPMYSRGEGKPNWPLTRNSAIPGSGRFYPPSITVYSKDARGDMAPVRTIQGPNANLDWPTGLAFDPVANELFVTNDMRDEVAVFDGDAQGDVAPKRTLRGPKTMIKNPTGVWVDRKNNELWVASFGNYTATVFPLDAAGDVAPKRVIRSGPLGRQALMIGNPHPVAYDSKREQILVPN
jgi:DNA-binding beta-propeller fold protein YncE